MKKMFVAILCCLLFASCTVRIYYVEIHTDPESEVLFDVDVLAEIPREINVAAEAELDVDPSMIP